MTEIDTSAEAVERKAKWLLTLADDYDDSGAIDAALRSSYAALRALLAERDAARAEVARLTAEVASLRLTLGGKTFSASVPEPVGCPMPGACATVAEIVRAREMQAAWMRVIQAENTCGVTGKPCDAVRCGCSAEQEMLIGEAAAVRAALAGEGREDG